MALRASSRLNSLKQVTPHIVAVPSVAIRRVRTSGVCMADQSGTAKLDNSTPDSTWKKVLSAQEVRAGPHCESVAAAAEPQHSRWLHASAITPRTQLLAHNMWHAMQWWWDDVEVLGIGVPKALVRCSQHTHPARPGAAGAHGRASAPCMHCTPFNCLP
jgi:hypothetical protein